MKNVKTLAYLMAAAMVSTFAMTSCKDKAELAEQGQGSYNGEVVKTEFSISLPSQAVKGAPVRRMPDTTVQLKDGEGVPKFQGMTGITLVPFARTSGEIVAGDVRLGDNIALGDINAASELGTASKAKVYPNVSIPMSTSSFLLYAKSKASGTNSEVGVLEFKNSTNNDPANFGFELKSITSVKGAPMAADGHGDKLLAYLNSVADAVDAGSKAWEDYEVGTDDPFMSNLVAEFKEWHSLSSFSVARGLSDLYKTLSASQFAGNTLATNIKAAIANAEYATISNDSVKLIAALTNFPTEFDLPEGSVRIVYNSTSKAFEGCTESQYSAADNAWLDDYVYPAQLWYYANSLIRTSNSSKQAMYDNENNWTTILNAHTNGGTVNSVTRAVAIEDVIQYAVARLDVIVKLSGTTLADKEDKAITNASYPVTAVLIGGQKNVGFDFTPVSYTGSNTKEYTIYDKVMTGTTINATTTNTAANSTLVLQSATGSTQDVMIAIELLNNSTKDFIGVDGNVIPAGGKFYLIAKLLAGSANVTANTVFMQDYTTTATLTIGSLKNAYSTIPDLRTPQLELGMSVDLEWTAGNVYDITIE